MHVLGHVGATLAVYAPVGAVANAVGEPRLAVIGAIVAVSVSTLPDIDEFLPMTHRGVTHTCWFLAGASLAGAGAGWLAGLVLGRPATLAVVFGGATALSITTHLLLDSLTPMGIRPFSPLSRRWYSLDVIRSANPKANAALAVIGTLATLFWLL